MKRLVLAAVLASVGIGVGVAVARPHAEPLPFRADAWPAGAVATYAVTWRSEANASLEGIDDGDLQTLASVDGDLVVRSYGGGLLGFHFAKVRNAHAEILGKSVPEEIAAGDAYARVEPDGRIKELGFSPTTTPFAQSTLRAIVLELTAEVASTHAGIVDTALGRAHVEHLGNDTKRTSYETLDIAEKANADVTATGTVETNDKNIVRIASNEQISLESAGAQIHAFDAKTTIEAKLVSSMKEAASPPPAWTPSPIRAPAKGDGDRQASLARRSAGVTFDTLSSDVRTVGMLPKRSTPEWIWRDSAYLELHPDEAHRLLEWASKQPHPGPRNAAFDIVVASRTDAGQRALLPFLDKLEERERDDLLQHLAQIETPCPEVLAFVQAEYDRTHDVPAAYTLGGLAFRVKKRDEAASKRIVDLLEKDLRAAKTDEDRTMMLRALGNAGESSSAALVIGYARSENTDVRNAVAASLRRMEGEAVVATLLDLTADREASVASRAVTSLMRKPLTEDDWNLLAEIVRIGRLPGDAEPVLVNEISLRRRADPGVLRVFTAILASDAFSGKQKQRVEAMLNESGESPR